MSSFLLYLAPAIAYVMLLHRNSQALHLNINATLLVTQPRYHLLLSSHLYRPEIPILQLTYQSRNEEVPEQSKVRIGRLRQ